MTKPTTLVMLGALALGCASSANRSATPRPDPLTSITAKELYTRGVQMRQAGDLVRAEQYLGAAITRGYDPERALPIILDVCIKATRYHAALRYAQAHLLRNPGAWRLRYVAAMLHVAVGDTVQARRQLERVVQGAPLLAAPHFELGRLYAQMPKRKRKARKELSRYLKLSPSGRFASEAHAWLRELRRRS